MMHAIEVLVNGKPHAATVEARTTLADFLRHTLGLRGTHLGCEHGVCGACTVLVDGASVRGCLMLAVQVDGAVVETVEGLAGADGRLNPLQAAFSREHALQCGYCTPGMLMTLVELFREVPAPDEHAIREAISGNLCRCTGYQTIIRAALSVAGRPAEIERFSDGND